MDGKIIYQVLPRLWGRGRFSDWKKKDFDYLKSLCVDYVWYTGIPRHASGLDFVKGSPGSPYSVEDWFDTNPYFSAVPEKRMDDFRSLVRRTHAAGLKVITDFIPNHVARSYRGPIPVFDYCDYDWTDTVKINYGDASAVPAMLEVLKFWAGQGVDGFRCDMVELVPRSAMRELISSVKAEFPHIVFIAEVYNRDDYRAYLDYVGFDLLYDKSGSYDLLRRITCSGGSAREITWNWQFLGDMQPRMLNFLENHDEQRLASSHFAGNPARGFAALGASALLGTSPFMLYFGQELGEDAATGAEGRTSIFNFTDVPAVSAMLSGKLPEDRQYILSRYRDAMRYASLPVFARGSQWDLCYCQSSPAFDPDRHFLFARYDDSAAYAVLCNFSDDALRLDVVIPDELACRLPGSVKKYCVSIEAAPYDFKIMSL